MAPRDARMLVASGGGASPMDQKPENAGMASEHGPAAENHSGAAGKREAAG
jgi:hypothetical protein